MILGAMPPPVIALIGHLGRDAFRRKGVELHSRQDPRLISLLSKLQSNEQRLLAMSTRGPVSQCQRSSPLLGATLYLVGWIGSSMVRNPVPLHMVHVYSMWS